MTLKQKVTKIKELEWDLIKLTTSSFKGAVKSYETSQGKIGVLFNLYGAYVVSDENGYFSANDIVEFILKPYQQYLNEPTLIEGVIFLAWCDEGEEEIVFDEELQKLLGINENDVEDIKGRVKLLNSLNDIEYV